MKRYRLKVRRRTTEFMVLTVKAESMVQARKIATDNVVASVYPGQEGVVEASIETCHEVLDDGGS